MKKQANTHGKGAQSGSTIVGVLVATVFMGIVAGSMVKNTGSQSAASRSYGTLHVASSTISSAMIETERYLASAAGTTVAQGIIQKHVNGESLSGTAPYLLHNNGQKRHLVNAATTPDQMYSSQIERVIPQGNTRVLAAVDVKSGRHASSNRNVREAMTFGVLGNVVLVPQHVTPPSPGGKNALFIGGSTDVIANVPMNIDGKATFMHNLHRQRNINVANGDLWVQGDTTGTGSETITAPNGITTNATAPADRIEKPLDMSVLPQSVGVTSHLDNNGVITHSTAANNVPTRYSITSVGRELTTDDVTAMYKNAKDNGRLHGGTHVVIEVDSRINLGFKSTDTFNDNVIFVVNSTMEINNFYKSGSNSSTMIYVAPPKPPVIVENPNFNTWNPPTGDFDGWNPKYIKTEYPGGQLHQLNIKNDFNGLIYVDPQNDLEQRIAFANEINFKGAIHMMGQGAFQLNNGGNGILNIKHDPEVLKGFKVPHESGDDDDDDDDGDTPPPLVTIPEGRTIIFRSSGYYFF